MSREWAFESGRTIFAIAVPLSAFLIGGVPTRALIAISFTAALATALLWWDPLARVSSSARWLLFAGTFLTLATCLQCLPLPRSLVAFVAPHTADVWARALMPFREDGPNFHTISLAPSSSWVQVLRGLLYLNVFLGGLRIGAHQGGQRFLERVIVLSCAAMAFVALAHPAVGAQTVLGIYRPREVYSYEESRYAPLLNTNHLAAYLNIGACVAFASLLSRRKPLFPRALTFALVVLLVGTSVWAGSRGGTAALVLGILLTGALSFTARNRYGSASSNFVVPLIAALGATVLIAVAGSETARNDLSNTDLTKLSIVRSSFRLLPFAPWVGVGRGAFEDAYPSVRHGSLYMTLTNPENLVGQWIIEWGVPVACIGAGAILWAIRPRVILSEARPAVGAWAAVVASAMHDLVDFHLEVPGVMVAVTTCAAMFCARRDRRDEAVAGRHTFGRGGSWFVLTTSSAAVVASLLLLAARPSSLAEERRRAAKLAVDESVSASEFRTAMRASLLRHPAEPFLPLMGAVRAQTFSESPVTPWVGAALERFPEFGRAHFVLARALATRNQAQARLEYRLAYAYDAELRPTVLREALPLVHDNNDALGLVPDGPDGVPALDLLAMRLADRLPSTVVILDAELLRRDGAAAGSHLRLARAAISDAVNEHPWCADTDCVGGAIRAAEAAVSVAPASCDARLLLARAKSMRGVTECREALDELATAASVVSEPTPCRKAVADLTRQIGDGAQVERVLDGMASSGCGDRAECIDLYAWIGVFELNRQRDARALAYFKRAVELDPMRDDLWQRIQDIATKQSLFADAILAAEVLVRHHPEEPARARVLDELRERGRARPLVLPRDVPPAGGDPR